MTGLEERLQRLEDLQEIHQLFVDYGQHLDRGDWDAYAGLFAEEGELLLGPRRAAGRPAIRALMVDVFGSLVGSVRHLVTSPTVRLHGDRATSDVLWTVLERRPDGALAVTMAGHHEDELRRVEGRWCFSRRKGFFDLPAPTPA